MRHLKKGFKKLILAFTVAAFALGSFSFVATAGSTNDREDDEETCYYDNVGDRPHCDSGGNSMCTDCDGDAVVIIGDDPADEN